MLLLQLIIYITIKVVHMMNFYKVFTGLFLLISSFSLAQTWNFDNTDEGWDFRRVTPTPQANSLLLTTTSGNNPYLSYNAAGINASVNTHLTLKVKSGVNGPDFLRIGFPYSGTTWTGIPISNGDTEFQTYIIDLSTFPAWTGTQDEITIMFRVDDGTSSGGIYNAIGNTFEVDEVTFSPNPLASATEYYVDLDNGSDNALGTATSPLKTIEFATTQAAQNNVPNVYIKSGTYQLEDTIEITALANQTVTLSPEPNGYVKLFLSKLRGFRLFQNAKNITITGFELDGNSNAVEHYNILSTYVWKPENFTTLSGGGIAIQVEEAEDILISNNYIHDFYQKAVNIEDGRYVKVQGNIITNIANTSLSGGHGIMRQQGAGSFPDPDDPNKYRWDIDGNMLLNVHQRIYSWVPAKGYMNWTLDEGKPILIDETPDHDFDMKARIKDNIVAFFKIDGIRIKATNNLEIFNNSLYSRDTHADGITDTANEYNPADHNNRPPFENLNVSNNAVDVSPTNQAYELNDGDASAGSSFTNNYAGSGLIIPSTAGTAGSIPFFQSPNTGNFNLTDNTLTNVGIDPTIYSDLLDRANYFGVEIKNSNWENDNLKNSQTLLDNVPGVEDGIANNETVFTDAGQYALSDLEYNRVRKAFYFTPNTTWLADKGVTASVLNQRSELNAYDGKYEIIVAEEYSDWYDDILINNLRDTNGDGTGDTPYARVRYGASVLAQDKVFKDDMLHVAEIESLIDYTQVEAENYTVTIDGDLLVDFKIAPSGYEFYDLIVANSIVTNNTAPDIFDDVKIENYNGTYTLEIITTSTPQVLRLTLTDETAPIIWQNQAWSNTTGPVATDNVIVDDHLDITADFTCNDLIVYEGKQVNIAPTQTLQVNGDLITAGHVTFESDASGTGRFGPFTGNIDEAGDFTVENFIPLGKRAFRFLASPINTEGYINNNWQLDTHITGSSTGSNGFDATNTGNPSMFLFNNQQASGSGWEAVASTREQKLEVGKAYRILIRGDRNVNLNLPSADNMNAAVNLKSTGTIVTGTQVFNDSSEPAINNTTNLNTDGFSFLGNPFVSPVNWNTLNKTGLSGTYWVWDPNMGSATERGRYVAYNGVINSNPSSQVDEHIQTSQSFFVKNTLPGTAGTIEFAESDKTDTYNSVFRPASTVSKLEVSLFPDVVITASSYPLDAAVAIFDNAYSNGVDSYDSDKLMAPGENISYNDLGRFLAINARAIPQNGHELPLQLTNLNPNTDYKFQLNTELIDPAMQIVVVDNVLNTSTVYDVNQLVEHTFRTGATVTMNRFKIIFETTLSTSEQDLSMVSLFPNPASETSSFYLSGFENASNSIEVQLYTTTGQFIAVEQEQVTGDTYKVTPSVTLSRGVYLIKVNHEERSKTFKLVIE